MSSSGKWLRTSFIWLVLALAIVLVIVVFFRPPSDTNSVNVSTILNDIRMDISTGQKDTLTVASIEMAPAKGK